MAPGVVADKVAGVGDASSEFQFSLGEFADHEESCAHFVLGQNVEKARRPCGVGAVVKGKREFAGAPRSRQRAAENLRGGPVRSIGKAGDAKADCTARTEHAVNTRS